MNVSGSTLLGMPRKAKSGAGKPQRSPAYIVYARISPEIGAAFEDYLSKAEPKPTSKAALELALKEFLGQRGFWPRQAV